jgi:hypothetical protein
VRLTPLGGTRPRHDLRGHRHAGSCIGILGSKYLEASAGVENTAARAGEGLISMSMGAGRSASADFTALAANYGGTVENVANKVGQAYQRFSPQISSVEGRQPRG